VLIEANYLGFEILLGVNPKKLGDKFGDNIANSNPICRMLQLSFNFQKVNYSLGTSDKNAAKTLVFLQFEILLCGI